MNEIEFRAWDKEKQRMLHVIAIQFKNKNIICTDENNLEEEIILPYDEEILMQYIGFEDENKKKIFKNDIITNSKRPGFKGIVRMTNGGWMACLFGKI